MAEGRRQSTTSHDSGPPPTIPEELAEVTKVQTLGIEQAGMSIYAFVFQVTWSQGKVTLLKYTYDTLFTFHCDLLDKFPEASGQDGEPRIIPFLPGKKLYAPRGIAATKVAKDAQARKQAERRLPEIAKYMSDLISLPPRIAQSDHVMSLFDPEWFRKPRRAVEVADEDNFVLTGWLVKLGQINKNWKKRYFTLNVLGDLTYYRSIKTQHNAPVPLGTVSMRDVNLVLEGDEIEIDWPAEIPPSQRFGFDTSDRVYCMYAASPQEMRQWYHVLDNMVSRIKMGATPAALASRPPPPPPRGRSTSASAARRRSSPIEDNGAQLSPPRRGSSLTNLLQGLSGSSSRLNKVGSRPETPHSPEPTGKQSPLKTSHAWGLDEIAATETEGTGSSSTEDASASQPVATSAPAASEWEYARDADGNVYYINTRTMETSWELPPGVKV